MTSPELPGIKIRINSDQVAAQRVVRHIFELCDPLPDFLPGGAIVLQRYECLSRPLPFIETRRSRARRVYAAVESQTPQFLLVKPARVIRRGPAQEARA